MRLCEALIEQGHRTLLATVDPADWPGPPFLQRFELGIGPARLARSPSLAHWLSRLASNGQIRLIHNHSLWKMPNVYPGWIATRHRLPLVVSPRGTLSAWAMASGSRSKAIFWPLFQRPAIAAAAAFHATSQSEYEDIRRMGFRQPVFVIPNGIDLPSEVARRRHQARTLLFVGRIHPIKGLDRLLSAWRHVESRFPEWQLRLVGPDDGGHLLRLQRLAKEMELKRVHFAGPVFGQAKWEEYRAADLFILPSQSENFGMAVAEALACGLPAIASRGTPWEGLPSRGAGWWIEGKTEELVACLNSALGLPTDALEVMGSKGREWMHMQFNWPKIAADMLLAYRWILEGGAAPNCVRID